MSHADKENNSGAVGENRGVSRRRQKTQRVQGLYPFNPNSQPDEESALLPQSTTIMTASSFEDNAKSDGKTPTGIQETSESGSDGHGDEASPSGERGNCDLPTALSSSVTWGSLAAALTNIVSELGELFPNQSKVSDVLGAGCSGIAFYIIEQKLSGLNDKENDRVLKQKFTEKELTQLAKRIGELEDARERGAQARGVLDGKIDMILNIGNHLQEDLKSGIANVEDKIKHAEANIKHVLKKDIENLFQELTRTIEGTNKTTTPTSAELSYVANEVPRLLEDFLKTDEKESTLLAIDSLLSLSPIPKALWEHCKAAKTMKEKNEMARHLIQLLEHVTPSDTGR